MRAFLPVILAVGAAGPAIAFHVTQTQQLRTSRLHWRPDVLRMQAVQNAATAKSSTTAPLPVASGPQFTPFQTEGLMPRPPALYECASNLGVMKANLPPQRTFVLGIASGLHVAVSALLALTVGGNAPALAAANPGIHKYLTAAIGLPFGLFMTVAAGGELFTGNTAILTIAVLEKRASWKQLARNWLISYTGNLIGSLALVYAVMYAGTMTAPAFAVSLAATKTSLSFGQALVRGILCNWLVCMAVYMSNGCRDSVSKFIAILLPISMFSTCGFEHSVANMTLIPLGMAYGGGIVWSKLFLKNLLPVTIGNILGGAIGVAYGYHLAFSKGTAAPAEVKK